MTEDPSDEPIQPSQSGEHLNSPKKIVTFKEFAIAIQVNDLDLAGKILSELMDIPPDIGQSAARFFRQKLTGEPGMFSKVMQIRTEIQQGQNNAAMLLIMECFDVDGLNAMQALKNLHGMA